MFNTKNISNEIGNSDVLYELSNKERIELKKCLIEIYQDFERICNKHSLDFMLGGGSVLGAIRHNGFIPWDDDLDIMMPRKDYDEFIKIFSKEMSNEYYLYAPNSNDGVTNTFAKLVKKGTNMVDIYNIHTRLHKGVWIDIFPIENVPQKKSARIIKGFLSDVLAFVVVSNYIYFSKNIIMKRYFYSSKKGKINYNFRLILGFLTSFISYKKLYKFYDQFVQHKKPSNTYTIPTGRKHYRGEILSKSSFLPTRRGSFENIYVNLPNDPESYLSNLYGDYMSIPPEDKRERHLFVEFDCNSKG